MSIASNERPRLANPCQKFIKIDSTDEKLNFWDKEKKERVEVPIFQPFVVIKELTTIKGYSKKFKTGIYSNEIDDLRKPLKVRYFKSEQLKNGGDLATGLYADIKDKVKVAGGRYAKSVYAYMGGELVNFMLTGSAFSAFFDLQDELCLQISGWKKEKNGVNDYSVPIFQKVDHDEMKAEIEEATKIWEEILKPYLNEYFKNNAVAGDVQNSKETKSNIKEQSKEQPGFDDDIPVEELPF